MQICAGSNTQGAVGERIPDDPPASPQELDPDAELREADEHTHGPAGNLGVYLSHICTAIGVAML